MPPPFFCLIVRFPPSKFIKFDGKTVEIKDIHQKLIDYKSSDKRNIKDKIKGTWRN